MPRSVLIADDSVTIRRVVELAFSETEVRVESAGTGAEALAKFVSLKPDVVLADVVMPEPNGYDICRSVKASERPVPVLLLSGTFEPLDPGRARLSGADGHLVKPFDSRILVAEVMRLLEAGLEAPPSLEVAAVAISAPSLDEDDLDEVFEDLAGAPLVEDRAWNTTPPIDECTGGAPACEDFKVTKIALPSGETTVAALDDAAIDTIVARVLERLSERVVREIAWDVVPDMAETIVRERLSQLERDDEVG